MNGFDVAKLTDKNFLRTLENAVRFGKWALLENIQETLDAALEPILMQQTFKQGGQDMMKLGALNLKLKLNFDHVGENTIPYNEVSDSEQKMNLNLTWSRRWRPRESSRAPRHRRDACLASRQVS